ncbi:MAG: efflux RND transporter permease subunit [Planctomycetes bacterium]|nr:efflux RND transporter permease subunit [Planctomycetota bacterium]
MRWLIEAALRFRVLVLAAAVFLLAYGIQVSRSASVDVFPEFAPPKVEVQTEAPGLSAEEVELLVTVPLEQELNGTPGVATLRSKSVMGLSSVTLLFENGTDLLVARNLVQERVALVAGLLPALARRPVILQPLSSTSRAMKIGLHSDELSRVELSELCLRTVRPRLMSIEGVANVAIWGQRDPELEVVVEPDRLRVGGATLAQVEAAVRDATTVGTGGFVDTRNQRMAIQHVVSARTPEELGAIPVVQTSAAPILLRDVADIRYGTPPPIGDAVINGQPGVLLIVEKFPWGNTLSVTHEVERAMDELRPGMSGVEIDTSIFRPATFVELSISNLRSAMLVGCVLVVLILLAFLWDLRTACISLVSIPLSVLAAMVVMHWSGTTLNTMVLAGLVIAVGEVVDDAIIDVENIARRLRLERQRAAPRSALRVVLEASLEVRSAVVYGSLIVVLVFVPVFFLDGLAGSFFRPLALAYVLAIGASLVVALTVTPVLSLLLLPGRRVREHGSPMTRGLQALYGRILRPLLARPRIAVGFLVVSMLASGFGASRLGEEFLPKFKERDFLMHWVEKPGTSIEAMTRITERVGRELMAIPGVRNFGSHIGRAQVADEVVGPNFTELWISIDEGADYAATVARVHEVIAGYPGLYRDVLTYLKERIKEVLSGASGAVVVRVFGPELDELRRQADAVAAAMDAVDGAADVHVEPQTKIPQIQVRIRPEAAARYGLGIGQIRQCALTLVHGRRVGEIPDEHTIVGVTVRGAESMRTDIAALRGLRIEAPGGGLVPLGELADVQIVPASNVVQREAASRKIDVTCNANGRDLGAVARDVETMVRARELPRGYHAEVLGEYAERQASQRNLILLGLASVLGIFLLLWTDFGSLRLAVLVFVTLPFALIGGVVAAAMSGGVLSLGSLVGFVTVVGIAARNGIMVVSRYAYLESEEGVPFGADLVVRGAKERLSPILMTAASAALALVPLVVSGDRPGYEIEHPLAVVIVGGLATSTLLNLFLLPVLYLAFGRSNRVREER